jgi:hypothetical protein
MRSRLRAYSIGLIEIIYKYSKVYSRMYVYNIKRESYNVVLTIEVHANVIGRCYSGYIRT